MSDAREAEDEESILTCEECLSPAEAFAVVGNETRLRILEALWRADRPAAFSDLRRRVGMRDSAQFNYHLDRLVGQFVRKTEAGYEFRQAGRAVIRSVLAGTLNQRPEIDPFPVSGTCVDCDGGLQARYEDEHFHIECSACGRPHGGYPFPPGGLEDRTREEALAAFNQRARHLSCLSKDGVCPECNGRMETSVGYAPEGNAMGLDVWVDHECTRCNLTTTASTGLALLDDAEVVSFYRDHGVDLNEVPFWTLDWCVSDERTEVASEDPWRLRGTIPLEDEALVATLDGDLAVVSTERRPVDGGDVDGAAGNTDDHGAGEPPARAGTETDPSGAEGA
ncbi:MAG: winged helix-turn-helix domain-containing protein [Haloarculaceae archaeon]